MIITRVFVFVFALFAMSAFAAPDAPWGRGQAIEKEYSKQKVVYDVAVGSVAALTSVLDRASFLSQLNGADPFDSKIVIVLHGNEIPFFAIKNFAKYKALMERAQSLSVGGVIEFRMCRVAARGHGFQPEDIHGFVTLVPMADAEIIALQQAGFAYMR
ncbi:MAG: DsrE family protein [Burkholderiales bacterium]|nr:DsrE family protein [Burkholderiales bacterium]